MSSFERDVCWSCDGLGWYDTFRICDRCNGTGESNLEDGENGSKRGES